MAETADSQSSIPTPTPGNQTSEFKMATTVIVIGTVLEALSGVLEQLQSSGVLHGGTAGSVVNVAVAVIGAVLQVAALWGYTRVRQQVKTTFTQAVAAEAVSANRITEAFAAAKAAAPVVAAVAAPALAAGAAAVATQVVERVKHVILMADEHDTLRDEEGRPYYIDKDGKPQLIQPRQVDPAVP